MKLNDRYLVTITERHEKTFKHGTLTMLRPSLTERVEGSDGKTSSFIPEKHLVKHGTVAEVPYKITKTPARLANPGHPQPTRYVSSETIEKSLGGLTKNDYNPSTYSDGYVAHDELYLADAAIGDTVHFYHTAVQHRDPVQGNMYSIGVADIFAYEREGKIHACKGFIICKRVEKVKKSGDVILQHADTKHMDRGIVAFAHPSSEILPGETVFHKKNADYEVEINGEWYFAAREYDCLCAYSG